MKKLSTLVVAATLLLCACGSGSDEAASTTTHGCGIDHHRSGRRGDHDHGFAYDDDRG